MWNKRARDDFFVQDPIVEEMPEAVQGNMFMSYLNYSTWAGRSFMHGADMLPWLYAWLENFLMKQWRSLQSIQKMKFKRITRTDLIYHVSSNKNIPPDADPNVSGKCLDNHGDAYYFYGQDFVGNTRERLIYSNTLPQKLFSFGTDEVSIASTYQIINKDAIQIPLRAQDMEDMYYYIDKMKSNPGYLWSTVLDMMNTVYRLKVQWPGLVMGYENLVLYKDIFTPELLFDGSCTLRTHIVWDPVHTEKWLCYKTQFEIINHEQEKIIDGKVTFLSY